MEMTSLRISGQQRPNSAQILPKPSAVCLSCTNTKSSLWFLQLAPYIHFLCRVCFPFFRTNISLSAIWGNFITANNPSIPAAIANGASSPNPAASNAVSNWPAWTGGPNPSLINVNQSGGVPYLTTHGSGFQVWQYANPGLRNNFTLVDATSFEGGRGQRCEFWKTLASKIPV